MHGVELVDLDDFAFDDDEGEEYQEEEEEVSCCSSGCMDCLGLSWRDFM